MCDHDLTTAEVQTLAPGATPASDDSAVLGNVHAFLKAWDDTNDNEIRPFALRESLRQILEVGATAPPSHRLTEVTLTRFIDSLPGDLFTVTDVKRLRGWLAEYLQAQL